MILYQVTQKRESKFEKLSFDFVIVGGGLSGVCSAISAAREGLRVGLVQDRPVLGGNASSEVRVWALGATSHMGNNNRWAREGGVIDEIMVENLFRNKEGNPILFDALIMDKVLNEPNITLFLNTVVYDVNTQADEVRSVLAFNSQNSTTYQIEAPLFCDASGDGIVAYMAGASFRIGAEDKEEFNEGFSPSEQYGQFLGHTIFFYPKKTDKPVKYVAPRYALKDMDLIPKLHQATPSQSGCNYWWFEYGGTKDTVHETEEIKQKLWSVVYGVWNHIKNSGLYPEAENMTLEWVGMISGKRESRRFQGLYMLTQNDIVQQQVFDDAVAYGGWAVDLHPADGVFSPLASCNQYHAKGIYSIPYRVYVSRDVKNLYLAGRLISSSHVAFGSSRVMLTCALGGQAIGTAAALCKRHGCKPVDLLKIEYMKELQYQLALNGQSIPHKPIDPSRNLLTAAVKKTSSDMEFDGFPYDGGWRKLDVSVGQLLPLQKGVAYEMEVNVKADEDTTLVVEWMVAEKPYNYTPDRLLSRQKHHVNAGEQKVSFTSEVPIPGNQYVFVIFRYNPHVSLQESTYRMTGILSVYNKYNKKVNNWGKQTPPDNSGFESFEFFTPERRPAGANLGFKIAPAISHFTADNLQNGYVRPYLSSNAWIAGWKDKSAELKLSFPVTQKIKSIKLYFDTDADHPMETIQWGHPESEIPFCISDYDIWADNDIKIASVRGNYQTINTIELEKTVETSTLQFVFSQKEANIPVALFQLEIH